MGIFKINIFQSFISSSQDSDIELIPIEEFYATVPISISRPEITRNDPHKLHLFRLNHELTIRKK